MVGGRRSLGMAAAAGATAIAMRTAYCEVASDNVSPVKLEDRAKADWIEVSQRRLADSFAGWGGSLQYESAVRSLREAYALPLSAMTSVRAHFASEARKGLAGETSSLAMLPTFVTKRVTGEEKGDFFALDLGGTNFRVLRLTLEGGGSVGPVKQGKYNIPDSIKQGTGEQLFGFIADAVATFLARECGGNPTGVLGFTFSFPVEQTALNSGKLLVWNKGFSASDVVGRDVVSLLQAQLEERGIELVVKALANDTVGTMEAASYRSLDCTMGVIFGTGTNGAYIAKTVAVGKWAGAPSEEMVINTEWGNLDMSRYQNGFDRVVDGSSANPGRQMFEKMISGMYLGEMTRVTLTSKPVLSGFSAPCAASLASAFAQGGTFTSASMAACEADGSADLAEVGRVLREAGITTTTIRDRVLVREACVCVSTRAARLSAMGVVGMLDLSAPGKTTVAIDGTVFEAYPYFKERMEGGLIEVLGAEAASNVELVLAKDGSGIGAAIIAAIAD